MATKLTNNYRTIKALSEGTFNNELSQKELSTLQSFEFNVQELDLEFPVLSINAVLDENGDRVGKIYTVDIGGQSFPLSNKALGDVFSKSRTSASLTDFRRLNDIEHRETGQTVGEILLDDALSQPKAEVYTGIMHDHEFKAIVGQNYPTVVKTGLKTSSMVEATIDHIEAQGRDVMFECKFDPQGGSTHAKIVYDFQEMDTLGEFAHGLEFRDNHFGSGKFFMGAYNLRLACMNGMSSRDDIAGIVANHTSVQNIVKPILNLLNGAFAFSTIKEEVAIMGRLRAVVDNPHSAFDKIPVVIDPEYEDIFYEMFARATVQYADHRRELETRVIRDAAEMSIEDMMKELDKLESKKLISKADSLTLMHLYEEDDTLPTEVRDTNYGLSHILTRYANNFQASDIDRYNELQVLGRNVLEVAPSTNYDRRVNKSPVW